MYAASERREKRLAPEDLTVDYWAYTNFFTLYAIADPGLSERLGFLDTRPDLYTAERMYGTLYKINYCQCLHSNAKAQAGTVWSYEWHPVLAKISSLLSSEYRKWRKLNEGWNDIVYH